MAGCMVDAAAMGEREVMLLGRADVPRQRLGNALLLHDGRGQAGLARAEMIGQPIAELIESERVTSAAGVPTIWTLLYQHLKEEDSTTCPACTRSWSAGPPRRGP